MQETPPASPFTKLPSDKGTQNYEKSPEPSEGIHDHLGGHSTFARDLPRPPNAVAPTATRQHNTSGIDSTAENSLYHHHDTLVESDNDDDFTDSDLTELDYDIPQVASDQSSAVGSRSDNIQHNDLNNTTDVQEGSKTSCYSSYTNQSTVQQWRAVVDLDSGGPSHRQRAGSGYSLHLPPSPAPTESPEQRGNTSGQPDRAAEDAASPVGQKAERRISSRLKTATAKRLSMSEYFENQFDSDFEDDYHTRRRQSRSANGSASAAEVVPKLESPEQEVPEADSWKTGWAKVDKGPKEYPAVKRPSTPPVASGSKGQSTSRAAPNSPAPCTQPPKQKVRPPRVPCPKNCGMTFGRMTDAIRHADQTTGCGPGLRPHTCPSCGFSFSRNDALRRHLGIGEPRGGGSKRHLRCSGLRGQ